ncbi:MAG: hypothetical protein AMJ91_02300 [candidate division Zixibacteria bacterium SM23_73_3]|nr:MAG: hypothetical protein AMJ91_02300 [candidate division Zixibacteria bacterium SM23_73_3]
MYLLSILRSQIVTSKLVRGALQGVLRFRRSSFDPEVSLRAERTQCEAEPKGRMKCRIEGNPSG